MSNLSKIGEYLEKNIQPRYDGIQKDHDQQVPKLVELGNKIGEALKKKANPEVLKLYLKTLAPGVKDSGELVSRSSKLMDDLDKLEPDPKLGDDFKAVEAWTVKASDQEGKLKRNFEKLKALEDLVNDAIKDNANPRDEFAEAWAVMETEVDKHLANAQWRVKQSTGFLQKGKQAVADGDADELGKLVVMNSKFIKGEPLHEDVDKHWKEFLPKTKSTGLGKEASDQLARDLPELKKKFDQTTALEATHAENTRELLDLRIKPINIDKALTTLKWNSKYKADLKSALEQKGPAREKALDALAKKAGLKISGDDIIETLQKAKVIP
jgi:hypothetical protein